MSRHALLLLVLLLAAVALACAQSDPTVFPTFKPGPGPTDVPTLSAAPSQTGAPPATTAPAAGPAPTATVTIATASAPTGAPIPVAAGQEPASRGGVTPTVSPTSTPATEPSPVPVDTPVPPAATPVPTPSPTPVPAPTLDPFQALSLMIQEVRPSIVRVETDLGTGSGVIFETSYAQGSALVLTNYHVIEGARRVVAVVNDASPFAASVLGVDAVRDLAVLRICCYGQFRAVQLSNAQETTAGTELIVIGYPYALEGQATVTRGIVSAVRFDGENQRWVIQTDAPINPGNSGGPMSSSSGEVVGITTFKYRSVGGGTAAEGLGFAVSGQTIVAVLPNLKGGIALPLPIGASPPIPTATPAPVIAATAVPMVDRRFTITINGVLVGPEERVVVAPFGQIRLSVPPDEDGAYSPGTVVTLSVFSNIDDLILRWSGVDLGQESSAIVEMFEDKSIRVRVGGY